MQKQYLENSSNRFVVLEKLRETNKQTKPTCGVPMPSNLHLSIFPPTKFIGAHRTNRPWFPPPYFLAGPSPKRSASAGTTGACAPTVAGPATSARPAPTATRPEDLPRPRRLLARSPGLTPLPRFLAPLPSPGFLPQPSDP